MSTLFNRNKYNLNLIGISYKKLKINNFILNYKFIIFLDLSKDFFFKDKIINNNFISLILEEKYIKSLFNIFNFSFLRNSSFLCIFINDIHKFINIMKLLEYKQFLYSYKNSISNIVNSSIILEEYNKYDNNFVYIQLILEKIKIKIIILLLFFLVSLVKNIK